MKALLAELVAPIRLFDLREFGFSLKFLNLLKAPFSSLPPDEYLHKQMMFEYLERHYSIRDIDKQVFSEYYMNQISTNEFHSYVESRFSTPALDAINSIMPSRFRYVSSFIVKQDKSKNIVSLRSVENNFNQGKALSKNQFDWRLMLEILLNYRVNLKQLNFIL